MAKRHILRGVLAGVAGGLAASWVMNEFSATVGTKISETVETPEEQQELKAQSDGEDATMKAADRITEAVTGGRHLTHEQRAAGGPVVHYAFGALAGGVYGGLAEYTDAARAGFGTTFGGLLFTSADLLGVPAFKLGGWPNEYPASSLVSPLAAHMVYGMTTELVRRVVRRML
jgi:hypothetical protein